MPQNLLGTEALTSKLSTVMFHHIRAFLPKIIKEITEKVKGKIQYFKTVKRD